MTLVVNLFGGPGTGKSTNAALTFGRLKTDGINAEIAHEYAKDLVWEDRDTAIRFQPYVLGKQAYRVHRLIDKVDVVITDSPILNSLVYARKDNTPPSFDRYVVDLFRQWNTLNIFLIRNSEFHAYSEKGRHQDERKAILLDALIASILYVNNIEFERVRVNEETSDTIVSRIKERLSGQS